MHYHSAHTKVARARGKAITHSCAGGCGRRADQWSYDGQDPRALTHLGGRSGRCVILYSEDPAHYRPLCRSCHTKADKRGWTPATAPCAPAPPAPPTVQLPSLNPARALVDLRHPPERLGVRKTCPGCGFVKDLGAYPVDRSKTNGRKSRCRPCDARKSADYYVRSGRQAPVGRETRTLAEQAAARRALYARHRARAVQVYGGRCVWCSATDGLEFDHVNNDGAAHRAQVDTASWYRMISTSGVPDPDWSIQLLCAPCHRGEGWTERRADGTPAA